MAKKPNHNTPLEAFLAELIGQAQSDTALPARTLPLWQQERAQAQTAFEQSRQPFAYLKRHSQLTDILLRYFLKYIQASQSLGAKGYCLLATGGYGREELYPYSDVDILILFQPQQQEAVKAISASLLHMLWDMKLKPGHACRTIEDCLTRARADHTITTALIDARLIAGDASLFKQFQKRFDEQRRGAPPLEFVEAKQNERRQRLEKFGTSRFLLEPNVKENAGGLRDLHLLYWLARYHYGVRRVSELVRLGILSTTEYREFRRAHHFHATLRIQLHHMAGRPDERLTFDRQKELSEWLGYRSNRSHQPVERFMKRYFQIASDVSQLTRLFSALLEEELQQSASSLLARWFTRNRESGAFTIRGKRLYFNENADIETQPQLMLDYFALAQEEHLDVHPHALRHIRRHLKAMNAAFRNNPAANACFLHILLHDYQPDIMLSRMNEIGLLGAFIPDFAYIMGQIQYDRYHIYTVDEHTIRLIGQLHALEAGLLRDELPLASDIIHEIGSRRALFVAAFCHDIAKGRGGNHEKLGVDITRKLAKRFGLEAEEADMAAWLVEKHLLFSQTAFSRDLEDPQTILDFVGEIQSPERLRCLLLITVADIRSVGPTIWNGWKGSLLRELFAKAEVEMGAPQRFSREIRLEQARLMLSARLSDWPDDALEHMMAEPSPAFWLGLPTEYLPDIAALLRRIWQKESDITMHYTTHLFEAITHIRICLPDHHALLHRVAGCITRIGGSILSIKSVTLQDGLAVMLIDIQDATQQAYENKRKLEQLPQLIRDALGHPAALDDAVNARRPKSSARSRALEAPPAIYIDNQLSANYTLVEVNATDRIGLLYDITRVLSDMHLDIQSSQITTYGEKAVDVFYVKDHFGQKITDNDKITVIRRTLLAMLAYTSWSNV